MSVLESIQGRAEPDSAFPLAPPLSTHRRRRRLRLAAVAAFGLLLAALGLGRADGGAAAAGAGPCWIWCVEPKGTAEPRAFYAARDFELDAVPAVARLQVKADEEYRLFLNGRLVGSGSYRPGQPMDGYRVENLLQPGVNRLTAELRSGRGTGGFLLELRLGERVGQTAQALVSDASWRILRSYEPGIVGGWLPLDDAEAPRVWGRPPVGRWGLPERGPERRTQAETSPVEHLAPPAQILSVLLPTADDEPPRVAQVWDWGREVEGTLTVEYDGAPPQAALLFAGVELIDPARRAPDGLVVPMAGAPLWQDATPRRLRYALILGEGEVASVRLDGLRHAEPREAGAVESPKEPLGVFGLRPPPARSALEERIWQKLVDEKG